MNPAKCSPAFPAGLSDLCNPKRMGVRYGRRCDVWMKSACVCPVRLRRNRTYGSARSPTTKNRARERKRARARRAGAEREAAARGNGVRERKRSAPARGGPERNARPRRGETGCARENAARPRAKDRCGTQDRSAGERDARKKNNAPAREGPVRNAKPRRGGTVRAEENAPARGGPERNARPRRGGTGCARENAARPRAAGRSGTRGRGAGKRGAREKTQRARARRTGAEREAAARGNGTRGRKTARPRAKDRCGTQDRSAGAELTRCGRGQAQGQWSRRTATKPSRTPITVKMAGFRLWAKACDCGSTSLKVT